MTEQRAEEIRQVVVDVLEDADSRASMQDGLMAGWSDHFFLASPDGRFKLQFDGHMQFRWIMNYQDNPADRYRHGFEMTRAKLTLSGHVFNPDLTWLIRTDATRNEPGLVEGLFFLRDAWFRYQFNNDWAIRFGQFKVPFNREELVSSAYQLAVERSLINESMNLGRTQGVELSYARDFSKLMFAVSEGGADSLGGFGTIIDTNPVNTPALNENVEWAFSLRYEHLFAGEWRQFTDFTSPPGEETALMLGVAFHAQEDEFGTGFGSGRNETRWTAATADLSAEWGGANAFGSFTWSYADTPNFGQITVWGIMLHGGWYITPRVEVFTRWEYGWWDIDTVNFPDLNLSTFGVNYYIDGHDLKWTTDLGWGWGRVGNNWDADIAGYRPDIIEDEPQVVFRTQFQLLF
jgi:hypothetical protein